MSRRYGPGWPNSPGSHRSPAPAELVCRVTRIPAVDTEPTGILERGGESEGAWPLLEVPDRLGKGVAFIPHETLDVGERSRDRGDARVERGTVTCRPHGRFLLAPMRGTVHAGTLFTWQRSVS